MRVNMNIKILFWMAIVVLTGCSGIQSYPSNVRAGDTAVVAAGWKHNFSRDNITVTITPSSGAPVVLQPGDPAVRAVINMYPDPLASLLISDETSQDITPFAQTYALGIKSFTGGDKDMWQTTVYIDLPDTLPVGLASIEISNSQGDTAVSAVEILEGAGQSESFDVEDNGPLLPMQMAVLERVDHFVISFSGTIVPHAIQVDFTHDPDEASGGAGKAYVVNPRGDLKNIMWNDDGSNLRVLLTPTQAQALSGFTDFKFYVSGGVTNLLFGNVIAVDINGNPVNGVSVDVQAGK